MLRWRLTLGPLFVAVLLLLGWLDARAATPGVYLFPLAIVLCLLASGEMLSLFAAQGLQPLSSVVYGGNLLIVASNALPLFWPQWSEQYLDRLEWPLAALTLSILWTLLGEMRRYERPGGVIVRAALAVFSLCYVGLLMSFIVQMRMFGPDAQLGAVAVASLVWTVKMGDIGAYTVGRLIGRHKLSPLISPGKTIEGAAGSLVFSCLGSWLVLFVVRPALTTLPSAAPWWGWIVFGLVVGATGTAGDLAESLLKRDMGQKDSSTWLPGFGGVLDLLDSALLAAPVSYAFWISGIVG